MSLFDIIDDIDDDGVDNGEEVQIVREEDTTYIKVYSNPFVKDTDEDGIEDGEDTAPFMFGMANGIVGELYIASYPPKWGKYKGSIPSKSTGHAWIALNSYVNKSLEDYPMIRAGYEPISYNKNLLYIPSYRIYPYTLKAKNYDTFGFILWENYRTWPKDITDEEIAERVHEYVVTKEDVSLEKIGSDFVINHELFHVFDALGDAYAGSYGYKQPITYKELYDLLDYMKGDRLYTIFTYNCTDFAVEVWNRAMSDKSKRIKYDTHDKMCFPRDLYDILKTLDGDFYQNFNLTMYNWKNEIFLYG